MQIDRYHSVIKRVVGGFHKVHKAPRGYRQNMPKGKVAAAHRNRDNRQYPSIPVQTKFGKQSACGHRQSRSAARGVLDTCVTAQTATLFVAFLKGDLRA